MSRSLFLLTLVAALCSFSFASTSDDQKTYYGHHHHHTSPSTPSTPSTPTPTPSHGGSGGSTPSTPKNCPTPSTPSSGHSGTPTPSVPTPSVPTPSVPTPSVPYVPTPSVPTPSVPTPSIPTPSTPPFIPDPNTPPFTCTYWRNHPQLIWGVLGWWGTMGNAFGVPNVPGMGSSVSLKDVLTNTRTDAYSELCRQATAALLNSMVDHHFAFSTKQVRDSFVSALPSTKTATVQANLFRLANEAKH